MNKFEYSRNNQIILHQDHWSGGFIQSLLNALYLVKLMSGKLEEAIIGMYSRGMTTADISEQVKQAYGVEVSEGTVSKVTHRIIEHVKEWQNRPLESVYFTVWMDGY